MSGLTVSNTSVTALGQRFVTKADTASVTSLGSASVSADSGVANTLGSWTQIIASTAAESYIVAVGITCATIATSDYPIFIELGTGGGGSEVIKWGSVAPITGGTTNVGILIPVHPEFRVTASKRVAARISVNSTTVRNFTVYVYGLPISQTEGN